MKAARNVVYLFLFLFAAALAYIATLGELVIFVAAVVLCAAVPLVARWERAADERDRRFYADLDLRGANLGDANVSEILADVPLIENIDQAILNAVESSIAAGKDGLNMATWHTCESTHCRAGWAIHLAGAKGYKLEEEYGPSMAGALLYLKAGATVIPDWVASDEDALTDLRARAGAQS